MADEQPEEQADGTPKLFKSMTGVIGGATAVVVALGGLYTAYDKFMSKPKQEAEAVSPEDQDGNAAADAPQPVGAESPQETRNSYETGDGGTLEWVNGMWVWTDGEDNTYRYSEESNDGVTIVGKMLEDGKYVWLQFPVAGGQALQSYDDQSNWKDPIKVTVKKAESTDG
jgi:hypothetical protein